MPSYKPVGTPWAKFENGKNLNLKYIYILYCVPEKEVFKNSESDKNLILKAWKTKFAPIEPLSLS